MKIPKKYVDKRYFPHCFTVSKNDGGLFSVLDLRGISKYITLKNVWIVTL